MSKKKNTKIEKETRKLIETVSDLIKVRNQGYKFKNIGKKQIRRVKRTCVHWAYDKKGKIVPSVITNPKNPTEWLCGICGATWPILPGTDDEYRNIIKAMTGIVNQAQFWSVGMGGSKEDTHVFMELRKNLKIFGKIEENIVKNMKKKQRSEENRQNTDINPFGGHYQGYSYIPY